MNSRVCACAFLCFGLFLHALPAWAKSPQESAQDGPFHFVDKPGEYLELRFGDRKVLRFINRPHDGSSQETHYASFKPFHELFDPETGNVLLSSSVHPNTKEFLYPHHRGLFFGFNRISYDGRTADNWHGNDNAYSECLRIEDQTSDSKRASHTAVIGWFGTDGEQFAEERRTVTAYNISGGTQIDWSTRLTTTRDLVRLDGDPQHAGFHFRANQEVAKLNSKHTYYVRPDGQGQPGETRNWDPKSKDSRTINLPWNAVSFLIQDHRYTLLRINHPDNPHETRGSERDYGRFGDYFEFDLTPLKPLELKYRIWVQSGTPSVEQCAKRADEFHQVHR